MQRFTRRLPACLALVAGLIPFAQAEEPLISGDLTSASKESAMLSFATDQPFPWVLWLLWLVP